MRRLLDSGTAVNLSGVKKENVLRGSVLAGSGAVTVTNMLAWK